MVFAAVTSKMQEKQNIWEEQTKNPLERKVKKALHVIYYQVKILLSVKIQSNFYFKILKS